MPSRRLKCFTIFLLTFILTFLQLGQTAQTAQAAPTCASQVEFLSSPVFAIDIGNSYRANYIGYKITPSSTISNLWVKIGSMSGPVTLTSSQSDKIFKGAVSSGSSVYAYFHAQAPGANNTTDSTHSVSLFNGDPDAGGSEICSSSNTFTEVLDTLAASANKVNSITVSTNGLGVGTQTATAVVSGDTGTIAANGNWILVPNPFINFPSNQWQLVSTKLETNIVSGTPSRTLNNILYIASVPNSDEGVYTATFTFLSIGSSTSTTNLTPISYITSGGPLKFTGTLPEVGSISYQALPVASDCVITFEPNGAGGSSQTQTVTCDTATNLSSNTFTRSGYTFSGWNEAQDGGGTPYANNASVSISSALTLYAQWTANTLTVSYDANNGSVTSTPAGSTSTTTGATMTALAVASRSGYTFNGWFTATTGGTQITTSSAHGQTADFTLYAQWTAIPVVPGANSVAPTLITISFDSNGGSPSVIKSVEMYLGNAVGVLPTQIQRVGYDFLGWSENCSSVSIVTSSYVPLADMRLCAIWVKVSYLVRWDAVANGGNSQKILESSYSYGDAVGVLPIPTVRPGFVFIGWFKSQSGSEVVSDREIVVSNATYFAQWRAELKLPEYRISFNSNGGSNVPDPIFTTGMFELPNPVEMKYPGRVFISWSFAGKKFAPLEQVVTNSAREYIALWAKLPSFSLDIRIPAAPIGKNVFGGDAIQKITIESNEDKWEIIKVVSAGRSIPFTVKQNQILLSSKLDISAQNSITISRDNVIRVVPLENRTSLGRSIRIAFVNFAFESSKLSTSAKSVLDKVAQAAFEYKFSSISLSGHSDSKKTPIFDNLKLSQQRANQVQIYLLDRLQGLGAANIKVDVSFYSSKRPIFIQDDRYSRSVNRRVEISIGK